MSRFNQLPATLRVMLIMEDTQLDQAYSYFTPLSEVPGSLQYEDTVKEKGISYL